MLTIQLNIQSLNKNSFVLYNKFLEKVFLTVGIKHSFFFLKQKKRRLTLLKSPHVNKTSREQFEIKYFNSCIKIFTENNCQILKWLLLNKPSTIQIKYRQKHLGV